MSTARTPPETCKGPGGEPGHHLRTSSPQGQAHRRKHTTAQAPEVDTIPPGAPATPPDVLTTTAPGRNPSPAPRQGAIISPASSEPRRHARGTPAARFSPPIVPFLPTIASPGATMSNASTPPETCKGPGGEPGHRTRASKLCHRLRTSSPQGQAHRSRHTAAQAPEVDTMTHRAHLPHLRT